MTVDTVKNTFWIYTDLSIFELIITREDRDVWRLYLDRQAFDTALQYCKVSYTTKQFELEHIICLHLL